MQGVFVPEKVEKWIEFLVRMPEPQPDGQIREEQKIETEVAALPGNAAQGAAGAAEAVGIGVDGALQCAGLLHQSPVDMTGQGGHGDEDPGGGAVGSGIAEVVEDGQHLPVGVGRKPDFVRFSENVPVDPGNAVITAAEGEVEEMKNPFKSNRSNFFLCIYKDKFLKVRFV